MPTWQALQELFAFEPTTELDRWLDNPNAAVAVNRAAHLRLFSFGLLGDRAQASDETIDDGLKRWAKVLVITGQHSRICKQLKQLPDKPRALLRRFIANLISIELWLLGYEGIRPDGKAPRLTRKRQSRRQGRGRRVRYDYSPFYAAWQAAAEAFSLLERSIRRFSDTIGLLFVGEVKGSNEQIALRHDHDFDFSLFVAQDVSPPEVETFFAPPGQLLDQLRSVIRVLAVFLRLARQTARLAAGPWAWWPLIRDLIGLYGKLDERETRLLAQPLQ